MRAAFIFPGQGSQSIGMGKEIYENFRPAAKLLQNASDSLKIDFSNLLFNENDLINRSEFTQPAIVLNSLMCYLAFKQSVNLEPSFALGHSLGEFSALASLRIVNLRGKFMQEDCAGKDVTMSVILGLSDETVEQICKNAQADGHQIYAANYNCDGQIVIAGLKDDIAKFESAFKEAGAKRVLPLNMSVISHCPLLKNASEKLTAQLEPALAAKFAPVVSNASAKAYGSKDEALNLLKAQLVSPVLYKQSIKSIENEVDIFVEFGGSVLKGINKKITEKPTFSVTDLGSLEELLKELK